MGNLLVPVSAAESRRAIRRLQVGESVTQLCDGHVVRVRRLSPDRVYAEIEHGDGWVTAAFMAVDIDPSCRD